MLIQINTDNNIEAHETMITEVTSAVESALSYLSGHITRVEVHLSDENSNKNGGDDDIRCLIEARMEGRQPVAVSHQGATVDQAVDGAADKLTRMIDSILEKLRDQNREPSRERTELPPLEPIDE